MMPTPGVSSKFLNSRSLAPSLCKYTSTQVLLLRAVTALRARFTIYVKASRADTSRHEAKTV